MSSILPSNEERGRRRRSPASGQAGFTLLEMIIVMAILIFISIGIYQATTQTFLLRDRLSKEGEFYNAIRLSLNIMEHDIAMIYSPVMGQPQPAASASPTPAAPLTLSQQQDMAAQLGEAGTTSKFWEPAVDETGLRPSRFNGSEKKMSFVSAAHLRIYKDSAESDFSKVVYELQSDDTPDAIPGTYILSKSENVNAFAPDNREEEDRHNGLLRVYPLLHGVKSLKFRYYQSDHGTGTGERWLNEWDTDRAEFQNQFPDYIEMKIEVMGPNNISYEGVYNLRPEIPTRGISPSS